MTDFTPYGREEYFPAFCPCTTRRRLRLWRFARQNRTFGLKMTFETDVRVLSLWNSDRYLTEWAYGDPVKPHCRTERREGLLTVGSNSVMFELVIFVTTVRFWHEVVSTEILATMLTFDR